MARENWLLQVLRGGVDPRHEANTSRYVHEVLTECFGWPFEHIAPQRSSRGFVDYILRFPSSKVEIHVEVKALDEPLRAAMIRKYVVHRGRLPAGIDFHTGVLTNLREWQIFVAGPIVRKMTGDDSMHLVRHAIVESRRDIREIERLVGFRKDGSLRHLRAAIGESDDDTILCNLLRTDEEVVRALRGALGRLRNRHGLEARVPQAKNLRPHIEDMLDGQPPDDCAFSAAKLRQALCSEAVAAAIDRRLRQELGSRSRVGAIRRAIRGRVRTAAEGDVD